MTTWRYTIVYSGTVQADDDEDDARDMAYDLVRATVAEVESCDLERVNDGNS